MVQVRQYKGSDLDQVLAAWDNAAKIGHPFLKQDFLAQERKNIPAIYLPNADTWVVEIDNQVVGFIAIHGTEVGALFLQAEFHGRKLGKLMMDKAQQLHSDLQVEVFEKNSTGRAFYQQYGFTLMKRKMHDETGEILLRLKFSSSESSHTGGSGTAAN